MVFNIPILEFSQNRQNYLLCSMPFKCIDIFSEVLIYDEVPGGYQRKPEPTHFNKIRDYITKYEKSFILPTSIVLGLDSKILENIKTKNDLLILDTAKHKNKIFRIVDGQHRIAGVKEAIKKGKSLDSFEFPVIIVITSQVNRSLELEIFRDINSKAKRVKVDLITLATYEYRLREYKLRDKIFNLDNVVEHLCTRVAYLIKDGSENSIWHNAIKFDIHNERILGIIGVSSFIESIENIGKDYLKHNSINWNDNVEKILKKINLGGEEIAKLLFFTWDNVIKNKWPDAFGDKQIDMDIDEDLKSYSYKKDYYIQKTFGVKAINGILGDLYRTHEGDSDKTKQDFKSLISKSKVKNEDWKVGGSLSGLSSESGVNKLKKVLKNELTI